jgi:3-isopropylmalate dehydratase small subunit
MRLTSPFTVDSPSSTLIPCFTQEEFIEHVLKHTYLDFRANVRVDQYVVATGHAFRISSSREVAVSALTDMLLVREKRLEW